MTGLGGRASDYDISQRVLADAEARAELASALRSYTREVGEQGRIFAEMVAEMQSLLKPQIERLRRCPEELDAKAVALILSRLSVSAQTALTLRGTALGIPQLLVLLQEGRVSGIFDE